MKINNFKAAFRAKIEKRDQSNLCFSHTFEVFMLYLTKSFGAMTACVSLNEHELSTEHLKNEHFEAIILKQKWMSVTKVIRVFLDDFGRSIL